MITVKEQHNFIDYSVFSNSLQDMEKKDSLLVNTINQYSYCLANEDKEFKKSLQASDILLPDGAAVVYAMKFLTGEKVKKIAGADVHHHLLEELNSKSGKCFYLGSSSITLKKITDKLAVQFPNIEVGSFSPPFKSEFNVAENAEMIDKVNDFNPDVLFVGMTAPKQEKWAYVHQSKLNVKIICTIGAVFDFYAGNINRPSPIWINLGLEWFVRLVKEPKRMWKRYLYFGPIFIYLICKEKTKLMFSLNS